MKLSREKVLHMSHLILAYLDRDDGVEYFDEPQEIRQTIVRIIMDEMKSDEMIDASPDIYLSMGLTAENVASRYGVTREQQDEVITAVRDFYVGD